MNWKDKILELSNGPVGFMTCATTGLKSDADDEIIAVRWKKLYQVETQEAGSLYHIVSEDKLNRAAGVHKISMQAVLHSGYKDQEFVVMLKKAMTGCHWFTYNTGFQSGFLGKVLGADVFSLSLHDLPIILKAVESCMLNAPEGYNSLDEIDREAYRLIRKAPGFKTMCADRQIEVEAPVGVLPFEWSCDCLSLLFDCLSRHVYQ